jgi:hypothetical protein
LLTLAITSAVIAMLVATTGPAFAAGAPCFDQVGALPGVIPPWGFHTGDPLTDARGSYARAYGDINLDTNRISGKICQVQYVHARESLIVMKAVSPIIFHTHRAVLYGYPGNEITTHVKVLASTDSSCTTGTVGVMTMYASYNNVRSDSIRFSFPAACRAHDHLYHGAEVNAQVPPL